MDFDRLFSVLIVATSLFFGGISHAFEVPKEFEKQDSYGAKLWIEPKSLETIGESDEDVASLQNSKDDFSEIAEVMKLKGETLSQILNIKSYKIESSEEQKTKSEKTVLFFGSYVDSSAKLTFFAEIYEIEKGQEPKAYLLTRYKNRWTRDEIGHRFKVVIK